ncbi:hypothetical protein RAN64_09750, partial [Enterococcus lactis]|nr:hypothetical protein [Enterococcus lactis]
MVPVLAAYIAEGIAKRPGLVVGFVGGVILGLIQKKRVTDKDKKMDNKAANRTVIEKGRAGAGDLS